MLDPQVQIRIIDLANKWTELASQSISKAESMIEEKARRFDQAYKAMLKTIEPGKEPGGKIPVQRY